MDLPMVSPPYLTTAFLEEIEEIDGEGSGEERERKRKGEQLQLQTKRNRRVR
jgi:hypothetical protein